MGLDGVDQRVNAPSGKWEMQGRHIRQARERCCGRIQMRRPSCLRGVPRRGRGAREVIICPGADHWLSVTKSSYGTGKGSRARTVGSHGEWRRSGKKAVGKR